MPKTKISEFSATPANNTDIDSINIAEGCAPSGINDAIRELMAQLKDFQTGAVGDSFNGPVGTTTAAAGAFTTLSASGAVTLSGGTANGVAYLNGSKVVTSGSALTFDGTTLATTGKFGVTGGGSVPTTTALQIGTNGAGTRWLYNVPTGGEHNFTVNGSVISFQTETAHGWYASGSEQMRLTSTGLGIGTSSPAGKLHVAGTGYSIFTGSASSQTPNTTGLSIGYNRSGANGETSLVWGAPASGFNFEICSFVSSTITPRLTIDSSGNLGLGVTPSAWGGYKTLEFTNGKSIAGFTSGGPLLLTQNSYYNGTNWIYKGSAASSLYVLEANGVHAWLNAPSGTAGNAITFTQAMTLAASGGLSVGTTTDAGTGNIGLPAGGQLRYSSTAYITPEDNVSGARISAPGIIGFWTGSTPQYRASIDSSGNLLVGTTGQPVGGVTARLAVSQSFADYSSVFVSSSSTASNCYGMRIQYTNASPNGSGNVFLVMADTGGDKAYFKSNGGLGNYSANDTNLSDQRVKTDIQDASNYLAKICAIPVRTFKYKDQTDDLLNLGVIAQEVEAVAPELVDVSGFGETPEDGVPLKAIYQTDLQYALMKALQELKAEFDAYKASHP